MLNNNNIDKDDERDNNNISIINNKRLKLDELNNNSSGNKSRVIVNNNERLFRLVWGNKYIRNIILYYSKLTWKSILLPKYNNSKEINNDEFQNKVIEFKKSYGFKYDQVNKVRRMVDNDDHIWLLKSKVSRGDPLNFSLKKYDIKNLSNLNDYIQIYTSIKDDIQFYQNLFKNYSKYFEMRWKDSRLREVNYIIKCDCWAALQVLFDNMILVEKFDIRHYILAIRFGSINCAKYLLNKFNFKLNKYQIAKLLSVILENYKNNNNQEEDDKERRNEENYERCLFISKESQQIKEYGFTFNNKEQIRKNQTILFLKSRIENDLSNNDQKEFKSSSPVTSIMYYEIDNKPLKFIIESCHAIVFILNFIRKSSFTFSKNVIDNVHHDPMELLLSNEQLDEIKQSFTADELNSTITDFSNSHANIKTIKHLTRLIISFGCNDDFNIKFYNAKFNQIFPEVYKDNFSFETNLKISGGFANYKELSKVPDRNVKSFSFYLLKITYRDIGLFSTKYLFKFCKNDMASKIKFIIDFVQDIVNYGQTKPDYGYIQNDDDSIQKQKYVTKELRIFKSFLEFILVDGSIELLSLFIKEMVEKSNDKGKSFFTAYSPVFGCIQSIEVFDLFYTNQHTKKYIKIMDFINNYSIKIKTVPSVQNSLILVLNHIKSNYYQDYIKFCKEEFKMQDSYYSNEFFFIDYFFDDFKDKLALHLYWSKINQQPPLDLSISQFIKILESTRTDQNYYILNNIEIIAYVIKFRNQDLQVGTCEPIDTLKLFKYYYFSNQLEKALKIQFVNHMNDDNCRYSIKTRINELRKQYSNEKFIYKETIKLQDEIINKLLVIELLLKKLLKSIIKFNYIDDLNIIYQFIKNIQFSLPLKQYFSKPISEINKFILIYLVIYNNLNATKFLYEIDKDQNLLFNQTNLNNSIETISKLYYYIGSLEVIDYLIIKENGNFHWRQQIK